MSMSASRAQADANAKLKECASVSKAFFEKGIKSHQQGDKAQALRCYEAGLESVDIGILSGGDDEVLLAALCRYRDSVTDQVRDLKQEIAAAAELQQHKGARQNRALPSTPQPGDEGRGWFSRMFSSGKQGPQGPQGPASAPAAAPVPKAQESRAVGGAQDASRAVHSRSAQVNSDGTNKHSSGYRSNRASTSSSGGVHGQQQQQGLRGSAPDAGGAAKSSSSIAKELLKKFDQKYVDTILKDVIAPGTVHTSWDSITGLHESKQHLMEAVILPMQRPDLFSSSLRAPPKGVLLFGPPGNGKTLLAKAVASESNATFFSISASSLVSKYVGDGEKLVRTLFGCAEALAPSVVFIDEADALLTSRGEEHDAMRRLKTEVLVQMDGVGTDNSAEKRVLVLAATNRPADIDTACLRRFTKRLHIPLPDADARGRHIASLIKSPDVKFKLSSAEVRDIVARTDLYSFSDMTALVREAAMFPLRDLGADAMRASASDIRCVTHKDFRRACDIVRASASKDEVLALMRWSQEHGTSGK
eukprot:TRINITY_DN27828_c0_g3_i1.p1 TRINITY_DN27828_c0_g3~~TRINITY_DN27828_c0_g3_i1.p1  ORF type:complete len:532 (+),score=186.95 TRINITY_DN27828_c0_g3_i1:66-1661(+)